MEPFSQLTAALEPLRLQLQTDSDSDLDIISCQYLYRRTTMFVNKRECNEKTIAENAIQFHNSFEQFMSASVSFRF